MNEDLVKALRCFANGESCKLHNNCEKCKNYQAKYDTSEVFWIKEAAELLDEYFKTQHTPTMITSLVKREKEEHKRAVRYATELDEYKKLNELDSKTFSNGVDLGMRIGRESLKQEIIDMLDHVRK